MHMIFAKLIKGVLHKSRRPFCNRLIFSSNNINKPCNMQESTANPQYVKMGFPLFIIKETKASAKLDSPCKLQFITNENEAMLNECALLFENIIIIIHRSKTGIRYFSIGILVSSKYVSKARAKESGME